MTKMMRTTGTLTKMATMMPERGYGPPAYRPGVTPQTQLDREPRDQNYPPPPRPGRAGWHREGAVSALSGAPRAAWGAPARPPTYGRWVEGVLSEDGGSYQQGHGYGAFDDDEVEAAGPYRYPHEADFRSSYADPARNAALTHRGPSQRGRGPKGATRSDERIREQVCEALTRDDSVDARDVEVDVRDGEVTLAGSVPERAMKHGAEHAAESCRGVSEVHNLLRVIAQPR
jgi:osmotically-inducible protein OsmY